jgi:hypothetical protein
MSAEVPDAIDVPLTSIWMARVDGQRDNGNLDLGKVAHYMETTDLWDPIDLDQVDGVLVPWDGHHRLEAARRLCRPTIWAIVRPPGYRAYVPGGRAHPLGRPVVGGEERPTAWAEPTS